MTRALSGSGLLGPMYLDFVLKLRWLLNFKGSGFREGSRLGARLSSGLQVLGLKVLRDSNIP